MTERATDLPPATPDLLPADLVPPADPTAPALLDVPGVRNLRDAAITGVRPGLLYRSGHLAELTPAGADRLGELGLRTVIDLRTPTELALLPDQRHHLDFTHLHHPVLPGREERGDNWPVGQTELYRHMPDIGGPAIAATARHLTTPGALPALVHCAVGKDRTGLTIAVLQLLAGASLPAVHADFLRSNPNLGLAHGPIPYTDEHGNEGISHPVTPHLLTTALTHILTTHPSIPAYLHHHGLTHPELDTLQTLLAG
ncbi:tyrosine-protein phosphatase [Kitasatospora sp. NPDC002227]|uniref:tyrosine-protein phosphatase n=1 Tax=Kitasatospora sp. NPDC002227 TaxID=3154773 RepID=UPI00331F1567